LPAAALSLSLKIYDGAGNLVAETRGPTAAGSHQIQWDGLRSDGARAAAGTYRVEATAKGMDGKSLTVTQLLRGKVDAIDPTGDELMLSVNGVDVRLADVTAIARVQ
jgi:flagellar basal-body rod modification protein FlgD